MAEKKITYDDLKKVNEEITTTDVKGKAYAEVPQRVTAFRKLHPQGTITTEIVSLQNGVCVMKAVVSVDGQILGEGTAYENEGSSFINKTSYIENCETSAVGRALGFAGFGSNTSIASAEEVLNAINNQEEQKKAPKQTKAVQNEAPKQKAKAIKESKPTSVDSKITYVKKMLEVTKANVPAFLEFFSDKYEREIKNVDQMVEVELNDAIKMLDMKKADQDKTPKKVDMKGAING